jgi:Predicted transcriptional regulator
MNSLKVLRNIPVNSTVIGNLYPKIIGKSQKVRLLERAGEIVRLKRGLYVVNPQVSDVPISTELIANHLYGPSYVSMLSALRYYGLIPEAVQELQSLTVKHSRTFENRFGVFRYLNCPADYFSIGLTQQKTGDAYFVVASPEKALCDLIVHTPGLNLRYQKECLAFLEQDLRLDMDAFFEMNPNIFRQCAATGKKSNTMNIFAKVLENE